MTTTTLQQTTDNYNTVSMLHMNFISASTSFLDGVGNVWTANGNSYLDTGEYKFGNASAYFDGSGAYIDTPSSTSYILGALDYTIDCWVKRSASGLAYICGQTNSTLTPANTSFYLQFTSTNNLRFYLYDDPGGGYSASSTGTITNDGAWHHVAVVGDSSNIKLYIDGVNDGTISNLGFTIPNSAYKLAIGRAGEYSSNTYAGWIDDFRFTRNLARWTTNFDPPSSEAQYTNSIDTYIHSYEPTVNYGTNSYMWIGRYSGHDTSALVKWNLNSLSGSDLCDSSTLSLYLAQDFASASVIWSAYRLKRNWGELTATWNAYGSGTSWQTAGALGANDIDTTPLGSSGSIAATSSVGTEIQISLNPVEVQKLYDGTYVNYGFLIKPNPVVTSNSRWYVYSRNSSVTYDVRKPKLVINSHQYDPVPLTSPRGQPFMYSSYPWI